MLKLSHLSPLASGKYRHCFVHPHDSTKCVKVIQPQWRTKIRLLPSADANELEFAEYRRLAKIGDERVWRHLPRHYGLIETDMGRASVMEFICNEDGSRAPSLADKIQHGEIPEHALAEFRLLLHSLALPHFSDCGPRNLLCARMPASSTNAGNRERLFVIDGLFCQKRRLIRSHIPFLHRRNARRYCDLFEKKLVIAIEKQRSASC